MAPPLQGSRLGLRVGRAVLHSLTAWQRGANHRGSGLQPVPAHDLLTTMAADQPLPPGPGLTLTQRPRHWFSLIDGKPGTVRPRVPPGSSLPGLDATMDGSDFQAPLPMSSLLHLFMGARLPRTDTWISLVTACSQCQARHGLGPRGVPAPLAIAQRRLLPTGERTGVRGLGSGLAITHSSRDLKETAIKCWISRPDPIHMPSIHVDRHGRYDKGRGPGGLRPAGCTGGSAGSAARTASRAELTDARSASRTRQGFLRNRELMTLPRFGACCHVLQSRMRDCKT